MDFVLRVERFSRGVGFSACLWFISLVFIYVVMLSRTFRTFGGVL